MDETADLRALASRYVDLWEDQIAALAVDPALSELFRAWMGLAGMGMAGAGPLPWAGFAAGVRGEGRTEARAGGPGTRPAETRPGPRPLPLHLSIAGMTWLGSQSALPLWRNGWPGWNPARGRA